MRHKVIGVLFFLSISTCLFSQTQDRISTIDSLLTELSKSYHGLDDKADIYLSKTSIQTFFSGISKSNKLNIAVDPELDIPISLSFSQEQIRNIIMYVLRKYDLDAQITEGIISVSKRKIPPLPKVERALNITYSSNDELSLDLNNDTLAKVLRKITQLSNKNIFSNTELGNKLVNVYVQNLPFENALGKLAFANDLEVTKNDDGTFQLKKADAKTDLNALSNNQNTSRSPKNARQAKQPGSLPNNDLIIKSDVNGNPLIDLHTNNQSISDILQQVSDELKRNYVILDEIKGNTTINLTDVNYEDFLKYTLSGTGYTFKNVNNVYILGERGKEGLRQTEVVQLQYRSLEEVLNVIPAELKKGVELKEFKELNSIVMSGSSPNIKEIKAMLEQIDKPVAVINIELIIVDVTKQFNVSTGISAGVGDKPATTGGTLFPSVDFNLGGSTINQFLGLIGLGNLGGVGPNFYMNLKAMETNGLVNIQSTPRLSTLNGHEATINIGKKDYYLEQTQNVVGTQNPQTIVTNTYKPVNADFTITINPMVSGDEHITLSVEVNQSDFTARIAPGAPPGQSERKFKSMIRVKNNDMVILGGLERNQLSDSGKGLPLLSRVPFLKWLFGSRERGRQKDKLLIFIKPTIIY